MPLYAWFFVIAFIHGSYMTYAISKHLKPGYEWYVFTGWWVFSDEGITESGKAARIKYIVFLAAYYLGAFYFIRK